MKKACLLVITILILSCGIPEYAYISTPDILEVSDEILSVELPSEEYVNGFTLYCRYFYTDSNNFSEEDYTESNQRSDTFLLNNKRFTEVKLLGVEYQEVESTVPNNRVLTIEKFRQTTNTEQIIKLSSGNSDFYLGMDNSGSVFNNFHLLGKFSDEYNTNFVKSLIQESQNEGSYVKIEFAIIVKGVKIDPIPEPIYSDPLYLGSFELPIES